MQLNKRYSLITIVVLGLALVSIASAAHTTINTNDGIIDPIVSLDMSFFQKDTTAWQGYNVPTAVQLSSFESQPTQNLNRLIVLVSAIVFLLVSSRVYRFMRLRRNSRETPHPSKTE